MTWSQRSFTILFVSDKSQATSATKQKHQATIPTLNKEEEAEDAHDGNDDARDDEGQPPVRRHVVRSDQRPQDVSNRGVRVPQPHDQTSSDWIQKQSQKSHDLIYIYISICSFNSTTEKNNPSYTEYTWGEHFSLMPKQKQRSSNS